MLFHQMSFFAFFGIVFGLLAVTNINEYRKYLILAAGYYFYAFTDYRFLLFIIVSTVTDFFVGKLLSKTEREGIRKSLLVVSVVVNISILGFFKYFNFFVESFANLLGITNGNRYILDLAMPLGISYYTFQTLNYTIDVFRKNIEACENLIDYALFVSFFPCILSGPIIRASKFLPQLKAGDRFCLSHVGEGIRLFIIGLFMKLFLADRLGMFVDVVFESPGIFDSSTVWLAVFSYTLQIYFDFAGYSNMAIGLAGMLGYEVGINFNFPYLSTSLSEFWRRWHISLSSWIRDYLYIPLGGNRSGNINTYINLAFVMLLCGLWHGASWTFVVWGGYHGLGLAVRKAWSQLRIKMPPTVAWALTMLTVSIGWVIFRSPNLDHASIVLRQLFIPASGVTWIFPFAVFAIVSAAVVHLAELYRKFDIHRLPLNAWYTQTVLLSMLWMVIIFHPKGFRPFVYLNF